MDAFALSFYYGIKKQNKITILITALVVGIFHFFMPIIGNKIGISLFEYTLFKPKIVVFLIFLIISIDMIIHFFEEAPKTRKLNVLGIIFFGITVSIDSLATGLGICYTYDSILTCSAVFSLVSALFTTLGFILGRILSEKLGKYAFLIGGSILLIYSLIVLTN